MERERKILKIPPPTSSPNKGNKKRNKHSTKGAGYLGISNIPHLYSFLIQFFYILFIFVCSISPAYEPLSVYNLKINFRAPFQREAFSRRKKKIESFIESVSYPRATLEHIITFSLEESVK